jgi:peptidoglycan/xylan/chitin deacetylase (PgdA/CDA1 family)
MLAQQAQDPNSGSLPARLTNMASRFVARQIRSKPLVLRNARPVVTFTFDDVPASACEVGARILEQRGARATFYVAGGSCGTANPGGSLRASVDQLRKVWADGHEIGCHTYSHPAVRYMSLAEIGIELDRNQAALRKINSNIVPRNFAYPFGDMSLRTKRYLETRFDSCRSSHAGLNTTVADLGALNAWPLQNASLDRAKIAELIAETVQSCGWLIFHSHDVTEQPNIYGVSPGLLEWAVGTAKHSGCVLATVAEGLELIGGAARKERLAAV